MFFFGLSNGLLLFYRFFFHPTRTNRDSAGQIRTAVAARPNIAYLVATFGRDYSRNRLISMIYERKQNDPAHRGAGKRRAAGLG